MDTLLAWLSQYGYAGLFALLMLGIAGLPIPDETLMVFSGYLISKGRLSPLLTFAAGYAGTVCGISLSYIVGRILGHGIVLRYGKYVRLTQQRIDRVHQWFVRTGDWLLAIGYFIPGIRHFTALVAGLSELEFRRFALFAYSGAAVWVAFFLALGYLVGERWRAAVELIQRYTLAASALLIAAAAVAWWAHGKWATTQQRR